MASKAMSVLLLAGCLLVANANPRVLLQQPTTGMEETYPSGGAAAALHVEAPATEQMLSNFDLYLTPSQEVMTDSQTLMSQLSNPEQFRSWVESRLAQPDGVSLVSAVFSDLIAKNQAMRLAMALNQAFGQQQTSAQAGTPAPTWQPFTAYTLAIVDQMTRGDLQRAGKAIYWGLTSGNQDFARSVLASLDSLQARIGCTDPLKSTFRFASQFAQMQMNNPTGGTTNNPSNFFVWISQSQPLMACFESSFPQFSMLEQQGQAGGAGSTPGTTSGMSGQP